ncbi:UDP-3-O-acyl-N-acetylglucosamine deacetylase [Novacetimonas cocois]|uniref:UDP-3-O-acyl-N-acetylglucosamine deacetylase n=1 Tax=Novacetimonas cocois TaxID=1747507 RepID=A0A365Z1B1_9PROT|nr:UDP-3-O-acyl-N-acetylglucosamine deacetylase [Novacetimonas cocois]RBM09757.1 UDP-3-O-[3-hydroxymyristoyl] N-acetylglucosamine deacetylase [Novacetimonas cocois]
MDGMSIGPLEMTDSCLSETVVPTQTATAGPCQHTLRRSICGIGIGLHTGQRISLSLSPAPVNTGIIFRRTDLDGYMIPATYDHVIDTRLSTVIGVPAQGAATRVATIEHLMAALSGCGIDNAYIDLDGPEVPVFDGSASEFMFLLDCAGRAPQAAPRATLEILRTVRVEDGDAFAELCPPTTDGLNISMSIEFAAQAIGRQIFSAQVSASSFRRDLENCRTFTLRQEIDALHAAGLARGGSLENAIVVDDDRILNPTGLRRPDEFVRHKVVDVIGDLYLCGAVIHGDFHGHKSGHTLNNRLLRALMANPSAWRLHGHVPQKRQIGRAAA